MRFLKNNMYTRRRRGRRRRTLPLFIVIAAVGIVLFVFPNTFSGLAGKGGAPLWKFSSQVGDSAGTYLAGVFRGQEELALKNKALRRRIEELERENTRLSVLEKDYNHLMESLGRDVQDRGYIYARILSKPSKTLYDTLILDVGRRDGVEAGDGVYAHDAVPIGRVVEVESSLSRAVLYSSPKERNDVVFAGGIHATAVGRGGGQFFLELPKGVAVETGEHVRLARDSTSVLGVVEEIEEAEAETFQRVYVRSLFNIHEAQGVLVET